MLKSELNRERITEEKLPKHIIANTKFPNLPLSLNLRYPIALRTDWYGIMELYLQIFPQAAQYEVGGIFDIKKGFTIQPIVSHFDPSTGFPYVSVDGNSETGIVWHSHPPPIQREQSNSYPSEQDMLLAVNSKHLISLVLTPDGVFIIAALSDSISKENVKILLADLEEFVTEFTEQKNHRTHYIATYFQQEKAMEILSVTHLFIRFIPMEVFIGKDFYVHQATIENTVLTVYKLRKNGPTH